MIYNLLKTLVENIHKTASKATTVLEHLHQKHSGLWLAEAAAMLCAIGYFARDHSTGIWFIHTSELAEKIIAWTFGATMLYITALTFIGLFMLILAALSR